MKAKKLDFRTLYIISAVEMIVFFILITLRGTEAGDTVTYFTAWDTLLSGIPDSLRTPLYPVFVGSLRAVFGVTAGRIAVCLIQCALFLCSIRWFAKLAEALTGNRTVTFWATAVYAVYPGPLTLNCMLLTESLALSGTTGLLWLTYKAFTRNDTKAAVGAAVVTCALVLLRPALIFIPLLFGLFWLIALIARKSTLRTAAISLSGCVVALAILGGYCLAMKSTYGISSPSSVSAINNYFTIREAGIIDSQQIGNPRMRQIVDSILAARPLPGTLGDTWAEVDAISANANPAEMAEFTTGAISAHPVETVRCLMTVRLPEAVGDDAVYGGSVLAPVRALTKLIGVNIGGTLALLLVFVVILLRNRSFEPVKWLVAALFTATVATAVLGAQGEWQRLIVPAYPALLVMASCTLMHAAKVIYAK